MVTNGNVGGIVLGGAVVSRLLQPIKFECRRGCVSQQRWTRTVWAVDPAGMVSFGDCFGTG